MNRPSAEKRGRLRVDPRLVIGLILVAASVLGVTALVAAADRTTGVYSAGKALSAGDVVTASTLTTANVRLGANAKLYLSGAIPGGGVVITRSIAAGELIPLSAIGDADSVDVSSLVVHSQAALAENIGPGSVVDLWSATAEDGGIFAEPTVLVSDATVVRILEPGGIIVGDDPSSVEIQIPRGAIARVLDAIANGSAVSLIPVSQPLRG